MKTYTGFYYQVADKKHGSAYVDHHKTLDEAIKARTAAQQRQKELGYTPDNDIIVQVMWQRVFDENGDFVAENTSIHKVIE